MCLMQKEPSGSHRAVPSAPSSHFSVTKHLLTIACLRIQGYPQAHIFSFIILAKPCQFLERSAACSPAWGLDGHSICIGLLWGPDHFSDFRLGRLLAMVKEGLVGTPVLCAATAPTALLSLISPASSRGERSAGMTLVLRPALQERPLLNDYMITNVAS